MNKKSVQNIAWALLYGAWTVAAFLFVSVVLVGLPLRFFGGTALFNWLETALGSLILAAVIYILSVALVLLPFLLRHVSWSELQQRLGIEKPFRQAMLPWALFAWGMYFLCSIVVTAVLYTLAIPGLNLEQAQDVGFNNLTGVVEYGIAFVVLVGIAPLFEELLFRGYLFERIRVRNGYWVSAIVTSVAFGVLHGQVNVGIDVFILSLFLCYLRERFDSIWPGVLVHAFKNGLAYMLLFLLPLYGIHLI